MGLQIIALVASIFFCVSITSTSRLAILFRSRSHLAGFSSEDTPSNWSYTRSSSSFNLQRVLYKLSNKNRDCFVFEGQNRRHQHDAGADEGTKRGLLHRTNDAAQKGTGGLALAVKVGSEPT